MDSRQESTRAKFGPAQVAVLIATLLAAGASLLLLWLPVYQGVAQSTRAGPDGSPVGTIAQTEATLLERNGAAAAVMLAVPVLLAALPLLLHGRRAWRRSVLASAGLLGLLVLITGFSIGGFYGPSAVALGVAVVLELRGPVSSQGHR